MKKSSLLAHAILMFAASGFLASSPSVLARTPQTAASAKTETQHSVCGTIRSVEGSTLTIETRDKKIVKVNTKPAADAQRSVVFVVGRAVLVQGAYDAKGTLQASTIQRAKPSPALWPEDK